MQAVEFFADNYPGSLMEADDQGRLPLHIALDHAYWNTELIRSLLDRCPQSLYVPDDSGRTPLHVACENCSSQHQRLGSLPLSSSNNDSFALFLVLNQCHVNLLLYPDRWGQLPIHSLLASRNAFPTMVELLLDQAPSTIEGSGTSDILLPCLFAAESDAPVETIFVLLLAIRVFFLERSATH